MRYDREPINAPRAPDAVGPYSHAVKAGGLLFCSGQIPLDPASGEIVGDTPAEQTRRCLQNLQLVSRPLVRSSKTRRAAPST